MKKQLQEFFKSLDRADFIDSSYKIFAAFDGALPIGYGQTISQPSLVLYMTEKLQLDKECTVLEIGTGSGFQTAFLAQFARHVYTIEFIPELSKKAQERLDTMGFDNITYKIGDGSQGWGEFAPFDRIIVTAAPQRMPDDLMLQLTTGGVMILPVGTSGQQQLKRVTRSEDGKFEEELLLHVAFVEMVGKYS